MRADRAAAYVGMATSTFLDLVDEGAMPKGMKVRGMRLWDRLDLDAAFENLKQREARAERNTCAVAMGISDEEVEERTQLQ
jgi:predicted DNA-binding transcriptional regulator AlpA